MFRFWKLIQLSTTIFFLIAGFHASRHSKQINMINIKSKTVQGIKSRICETKRVDVNMQRLRSEQFFLSKSFHLFFRSFPFGSHTLSQRGTTHSLKQNMQITFSPKGFLSRRHAGAHPDGHQHGGPIPTETIVTEFCYKRVNLFLEEFKNIKIIPFQIHEPIRSEKLHE